MPLNSLVTIKFIFIAERPINNIIQDKHAANGTHFRAETTLCFNIDIIKFSTMAESINTNYCEQFGYNR